MSENEIQKTDDDEISLVDLFVVLIKHRKLIIVFALLGLVVSAAYYVIQIINGSQIVSAGEALTGNYEGRMAVVMNPRIGRSSATDRFPAWFSSRELIEAALEEAGLNERRYDSVSVSYNQDGADVVLKSGAGDKERVEKLFSILLDNVEIMAVAYYTEYAEDIVSYFEALRETGKDYSAQDYVRYCWAKDLLAGDDTVLKLLYPSFIFGEFTTTFGSSASSPAVKPAVAVVVFLAFLFFAVFLAFALNAIKNISGDKEVMAKIRGALGKGDGA
ncbi:MAG: hypothetical protein LBU19_07460 [Treponema sp.]|nr:hypothetical protein [Treponema sp.]